MTKKQKRRAKHLEELAARALSPQVAFKGSIAATRNEALRVQQALMREVLKLARSLSQS